MLTVSEDLLLLLLLLLLVLLPVAAACLPAYLHACLLTGLLAAIDSGRGGNLSRVNALPSRHHAPYHRATTHPTAPWPLPT